MAALMARDVSPRWSLDDFGDDDLYSLAGSGDDGALCGSDMDSMLGSDDGGDCNYYSLDELYLNLRSNDPDETHLYMDCLNDSKAADLGAALRNNTRVTVMELGLTKLSAAGPYEDFLQVLRTSPSLATVKLSGTMFGPTACPIVTWRFLAALARNRNNLIEVELYNVHITAAGLSHFVRTSRVQNLRLRHLYLSGAPQTLVAAFASNTLLTSLECICLDERYLTAVLDGSKQSQQMQRLCVDEHSSTTLATVQALRSFLQASSGCLTTLELTSFRWTATTFAPVVAGIVACKSLIKLSLDYCRLDDAATAFLESFLTHKDCRIQTLLLGGFLQLGTSQALANVVRGNRSLLCLIFDASNVTSGFDSEAFFRALVVNTTLLRLNVGYLSKRSECDSFCNNFGKVTGLVEFHVEFFEGALAPLRRAIHDAFLQNGSLRRVHVHSSSAAWIDEEILQRNCQRNRMLQIAQDRPGAVTVDGLWPGILQQASETHQGLDTLFAIVPALVGKGVIGQRRRS